MRSLMGALATELGVGRTTLYRWTGDRDRLLSDLCIADLDEFTRFLDNGNPALNPDPATARVVIRLLLREQA